MVDQDAYQAAMKEAGNAAWNQDWARAIKAYRRAAELKPDDSQAIAGLALSLMESGRAEEAMRTYQRLSQLVPNEPLAHEKMAAIHEAAGRTVEAAKEHMTAAEMYFQRHDLVRAVAHWQATVQFDPQAAKAYMRLAAVYERDKSKSPLAVYAYLNLARLLQKFNRPKEAEQVLLRAQRLEMTNLDVRNALADLKRGVPLAEVEAPEGWETSKPQTKREAEAGIIEEEKPRHTPIEEAAEHAMGLLAELVFSGEVPAEAQLPLVQATEMQRLGDAERAIKLYSQAFEAGLNHPALRFNLGLLYQQARQYRNVIGILAQSADVAEYAIASNMALGVAHFSQDSALKGAQHLVQALQHADRALNPQAVDSGGYERLLNSLPEQEGDHLAELCKALTIYLDDTNWRSKLRDTLAGYAAQGKTAYVPDLIELIIEGGRPEIAESMQRVDRYLLHNKLLLAMEEIHFSIEKSPDYLPAHRRLADILVKEGRREEAAEKLKLVADTYLVRGNIDKATDLFAEALELNPGDVESLGRLVDMFKEQKRVAEALQAYGKLADAHYRLLADASRAIEIYNEALQYARANRADSPQMIAILKAMANIEAARLNWRQALEHYNQIIKLAPDDENATLEAIELNFQLGNTAKATETLDAYINHCITRGQAERAVSVLEEQVRRHPDEIALRQRLAGVYRQQKRIVEAVAQMDAIGELQLDAGQREAAIKTIRQIIELNPPDVEGYRRLLEQLESA